MTGLSAGGRFNLFACNSYIAGLCESKLGEMVRSLNKKKGKGPERGWLGPRKEVFRVVSVRKNQSSCGLGGKWMEEKGDFKKYRLNKEPELL